MSAWVALGAGCFGVVVGLLTLIGRAGPPHARSRWSGWGRTAMGGGFVMDGGARVLGVPSGVGLVVSAMALGLVVLGAVLQIRAGAYARARHVGGGD
ncbi:hypothetical protein AB0C59_26555 [Streptomyces sp. NPDC048664]|uniref:hypothetical protein n=1 Tax=Streptomyces sp. NPDC048664 TaxID=3154505 RepID=UPI00342F26A1